MAIAIIPFAITTPQILAQPLYNPVVLEVIINKNAISGELIPIKIEAPVSNLYL